MSNQTFSLFHHAAPPKSGLADRPPLLLLLHGFGSNEDDLFSLAPYLDERFLVISARAPVALGPMSYAWFSLGFTPEGVLINAEEAESSRLTISRFIDELIDYYRVDSQAIYLMGFSQGAMMSLSTALNSPGTVAGVVAMSGRLLPQTAAQVKDPDALFGLPIFVLHGTRDMVLPVHHGRATRDLLTSLPVDLQYREYEMGHEVSAQSLEDIAEWLKARLDGSAKRIIVN
ncbi:MAG: alpha/beta fold hydrolase [Acidobacteria bacterium]|nr:alpha/beta fold hydrolase [Acidobacteriota bacterium]